MKTIVINHCCPTGLQIVLDRDRAWTNGNFAESIRLRVAEAKHLETCAACNRDLEANELVRALFKPLEVKVRE